MRRLRELLLIGWLLLSPLIVSCASAPTAVPAPTPTPAEAKPPETSYIIPPGETLAVFVWQHPELSVTVQVRPDGKISTPHVEDMVALGKTPTQLARDMEKALSEYVRAPKVNVIVSGAFAARSPGRLEPGGEPVNPPAGAVAFGVVSVTGEVARPSKLPYHQGMTVLDAILAAGGLRRGGNRDGYIVRTENGFRTDIPVSIDDLATGGDVPLLVPGDVVVVGRASGGMIEPLEDRTVTVPK